MSNVLKGFDNLSVRSTLRLLKTALKIFSWGVFVFPRKLVGNGTILEVFKAGYDLHGIKIL